MSRDLPDCDQQPGDGIEDLHIGPIAAGKPYHAALIVLSPRQPSAPILHRHVDFCEMFYVLSGHGTHRLAGGTVRLGTGELILMRPTDEHTFSGLPPNGIVYINVAFPLTPWHSFLRLVGYQRLWDEWRQQPRPRAIYLHGSEAARIQAAFQRTLDRFQADPSLFDVVELWCQTMPLLAPNINPELGDVSTCPSWLSDACTAMRQEENLQAGLPRFRQLAPVSASHLARMMRLHYGASPVEWITSLRLEHAATLLATTRTRVTEIAMRCGFSSQSYFSHCFQRAYGSSPRAYRNQGRQAVVP